MKVEVEDLSPIEKKVKVEIPAEQVKDEFELAWREVQKRAQIKGFRPGKAPRKILEQHFKDYVKEQVLKKLLQETIGPALDRKQLKPVVEPEIELGELAPDAPFTYTLQVELKPEVELVNYKGIELERDVFEITDEMVAQALEDLRNRHSYYQEVKESRKAQEGDLLIMDLKAELEGKILERESGENLQYPMGAEVHIPNFAQQVGELLPGQKKTFRVKYPDDHQIPELAGKEVDYTVEIKGLKEKVMPELNDQFAQELGEFKDLAELKEKVRRQLEEYYQRISRVRLERALLDKLVELNPVEVPKKLVRRRAQELAQGWFQRMGINNPGQEEFEKMVEEFTARAEKEIKAGFILEAVIEKEGIELTAEEEEAKLKELADRYQMDVEKLKDQLGESAMARLREQWLEEKALDFLLSEARIKDRKVSPEEAGEKESISKEEAKQ